jgi:hypothetical protein
MELYRQNHAQVNAILERICRASRPPSSLVHDDLMTKQSNPLLRRQPVLL